MDDGRRKAAMVESPLITSLLPSAGGGCDGAILHIQTSDAVVAVVADVDEMGQDGVWRDASGDN